MTRTRPSSFLLFGLAGTILLLAGCGGDTSTALDTPTMPASPALSLAPPTGTALPPTETLPPPTGTVPRPSETLLPSATLTLAPTETPVPPAASATPAPSPAPTVTRPSIEAVIAGLDGLPIDAFFEESYRQLLLRDPDRTFANGLAAGYGVTNDSFTDQSPAYLQETEQLEIALLSLLRRYDRDALSPDQRLSFDIYAWYLDDLVRSHAFRTHDFPVNSLTIWGKQNWLIDFMTSTLPLETGADAEAYIFRLSQIDTWVAQLIQGLELRKEAGVIPPRDILEASIGQVENHMLMIGADRFVIDRIPLFTHFREALADLDEIDASTRQALIDSARAEIENTFVPAFVALRDYLVDLSDVAGNEGGAWTLPNGEAYYAYALRHETTTEMSPEAVHELGLAELLRIQAEVREAIAELGYATLEEFEEGVNEESPMLQGNRLLAEFERLIDAAEQACSDVFGLYPRADLVVQREPFGSLAYYLPPPFDGSAPGRFLVTLDRPVPLYILPALTFHEAVPGHHLQGALTRELDIPTFRKDIEFNAYVEGWALYAERLAWEMGLYDDDPLSNVGRLQFEEMRALRLVVDTGVHARGWTWAEASTRVEELTGSPIDQGYLQRFYILPGQGSGYTIGMLKILELRQHAMDQLGEAFDMGEFHDVILGNGPMPLEILGRVVDDYIQRKMNP